MAEDKEVVDRLIGGAARMQFGILARRQERLVTRRKVVRGATVRDVEVQR
jgi:hypothetical protein